ncbi:beta-1,3-galactosyltransferase 5-like [Saccostrea echinata]|uniref:beta-1,3-galactosyltransferase 5-like n=1 Tax=Saccostrea echinata TaxID=191078 RepID=UPI002A7F2D05|nr:beta-1,3-galactosyltransferase 5-like [Saccostrea echinata]
MKKKLKSTVIWVISVFLVIYLLCAPYRGLTINTEDISYRLVQAYIDTGIVPPITAASVSCADQGENVFLLIMVPSAVSNFKQRDAIRHTWGNVSKVKPTVQVNFVLGKSKHAALQDLAHTEKLIYNDIVFEDVLETYENLTRKSIAILRWTVSFCSKVRYLLKIDDDMFLNLPRLLRYLTEFSQVNTILGCKVSHTAPFRNPFSKWYVSHDQYEDREYPEYIAGTAYLISGDVIYDLYQATDKVPYFIFEDVFITGLCRKQIGAVAKEHREFSCGSREIGPCGKNFRYMITGHHYSPPELTRMWVELQNRWSDCRLVDYFFIYSLIDIFKWIFL